MTPLPVVSAPTGGPILAPGVAPAPAAQPALAPAVSPAPVGVPPILNPTVQTAPAAQPALAPKVQTVPTSQPEIASVGPAGNQAPFKAKLTLEQFGSLIQTKYPAYASQDPVTVANAVLAKYPQYQNLVLSPPTKDNTPLPYTSANPLADLETGALKSVPQSLVGLVKLGARLGNFLSGKGFQVQEDPNSLIGEIDKFLAPKTDLEKVGNIGGDIAQFLIPGGQEEGGAAVASKVGELLDLGTRGVKAIQLLTQAGLAGANDYVIAQAQGQSNTGSALIGGLGAAGELVSPLIALKFPAAEQKTAQATWDMVKPELNTKALQQAVLSGSIKESDVLGEIMQVPKASDLPMIEAAKPYVVEGNPLKTALNINQAIADEATTLREAVGSTGGTWSVSNLKGAVNNVDVPLAIKDSAEMTQVRNIQNYVAELGQEAEKSAGGALDLAKQFRQNVSSEFGENIWNKDTPIGTYIRNVNRSLNDFAESRLPDGKLPDGTLFKDSLKKQSLLFDALDNVAGKVAKPGTYTSTTGKLVNIGKKAAKGAIGAAARLGPLGVLLKGHGE